MKFKPLRLATERLVLRPLEAQEADALFDMHSDAETMRYWSAPAWTDPAEARQAIERAWAAIRDGTSIRFGMFETEQPRLIGTCTLFNVHEVNRRAEVGYILKRSHWGNGLMREALTALMDYAFGALGLHRIEADVDPRNRASARTLEGLGFVAEGFLRERWIVDGVPSDSAIYGLLAANWAARNAKP